MSFTKKWVGAKGWLQADRGSSSPLEQSSQVASIPAWLKIPVITSPA
jgi:hypothetical protein